MKAKLFLLLGLILCIGITSADAQMISKYAKKSQWDVGGSIGFTSQTAVVDGTTADNSTTLFSFQPYGAYFVIDGLELGIMPSIEYQKYDGSNSTDYTIYFAPSYNFDTKSQYYPYIMGLIGYDGYNSGDYHAKGLAWGFEGGVKANLLGNSIIKLGIQYEQKTYNPADWSGNRNGMNNVKVNLGFNVFFY